MEAFLAEEGLDGDGIGHEASLRLSLNGSFV
jgi:hypothetical protein